MESNDRRPPQASLRRAVSTAYYALFHCLARSAAERFVGGQSRHRGEPAWHQVYRALEHGPAASACRNNTVMKDFPQEVREFASMFVTLQEERYRADYAIDHHFYKSVVLGAIDDAESAIDVYENARPEDQRAFVAHVLFRRRSS